MEPGPAAASPGPRAALSRGGVCCPYSGACGHRRERGRSGSSLRNRTGRAAGPTSRFSPDVRALGPGPAPPPPGASTLTQRLCRGCGQGSAQAQPVCTGRLLPPGPGTGDRAGVHGANPRCRAGPSSAVHRAGPQPGPRGPVPRRPARALPVPRSRRVSWQVWVPLSSSGHDTCQGPAASLSLPPVGRQGVRGPVPARLGSPSSRLLRGGQFNSNLGGRSGPCPDLRGVREPVPLPSSHALCPPVPASVRPLLGLPGPLGARPRAELGQGARVWVGGTAEGAHCAGCGPRGAAQCGWGGRTTAKAPGPVLGVRAAPYGVRPA